MLEVAGNLWAVPADATCITTNLYVSPRTHKAVMGRGVAVQARDAFPGIDLRLGTHITLHRSAVGVIWQIGAPGTYGPKSPEGFEAVKRIVCVPVKFFWKGPADLKLIDESVRRLVALTEKQGWQRVTLPRPGCGSGSLRWEHVRPVIERHLDDRFIIVERDA